jgi:hypothetical protein
LHVPIQATEYTTSSESSDWIDSTLPTTSLPLRGLFLGWHPTHILRLVITSALECGRLGLGGCCDLKVWNQYSKWEHRRPRDVPPVAICMPCVSPSPTYFRTPRRPFLLKFPLVSPQKPYCRIFPDRPLSPLRAVKTTARATRP